MAGVYHIWHPYTLALGAAPRSSRQQQLEILAAEACEHTVIAGDDGVGKFLFTFLKFENFFFDGIAGDEPVCKYIAGLADAVAAVDGLFGLGRQLPGYLFFRSAQEKWPQCLGKDPQGIVHHIALGFLHTSVLGCDLSAKDRCCSKQTGIKKFEKTPQIA